MFCEFFNQGLALLQKLSILYSLAIGAWLSFTLVASAQVDILKIPANNSTSACPTPVLSRLKRHKILVGDSFVRIAQQYNLVPETLIRLNPELQGGNLPVGKEILIPPFNGIRVQAPQGATWQDLENAYGVRADVLFEVNGCQRTPTIVFIPGLNWSSIERNKVDYTGLSSYPLPFIAQVGLSYGWQNSPTNQQRLFHSGIDLIAPIGTKVLAAEAGVVVYVGREGAYGNLIVISHQGDKQTRYAHLNQFNVRVGDRVTAGEVIGAVGTTGQPDIATSHLHFEIRYRFPAGWVAQDPSTHFRSKNQ